MCIIRYIKVRSVVIKRFNKRNAIVYIIFVDCALKLGECCHDKLKNHLKTVTMLTKVNQ